MYINICGTHNFTTIRPPTLRRGQPKLQNSWSFEEGRSPFPVRRANYNLVRFRNGQKSSFWVKSHACQRVREGTGGQRDVRDLCWSGEGELVDGQFHLWEAVRRFQ